MYIFSESFFSSKKQELPVIVSRDCSTLSDDSAHAHFPAADPPPFPSLPYRKLRKLAVNKG